MTKAQPHTLALGPTHQQVQEVQPQPTPGRAVGGSGQAPGAHTRDLALPRHSSTPTQLILFSEGLVPEPLLGPGQEGGDEAGRARSARKISSLMYCEVPFKDSLCPTRPLAFPSVPVLHAKEPGQRDSW